ncbi:hypothetical protein DsansV1_C04g0038141 [Dioscorea sansibarensis]
MRMFKWALIMFFHKNASCHAIVYIVLEEVPLRRENIMNRLSTECMIICCM